MVTKNQNKLYFRPTVTYKILSQKLTLVTRLAIREV